MVAESRKSRRICTMVRVISWIDGRAVDSSNQCTPRWTFRRTIPMFGHTASERLALPFLRYEQTVLCLIQHDWSTVRLESLFLHRFCDVTNDLRGPDRSIELIQYIKRQ